MSPLRNKPGWPKWAVVVLAISLLLGAYYQLIPHNTQDVASSFRALDVRAYSILSTSIRGPRANLRQTESIQPALEAALEEKARLPLDNWPIPRLDAYRSSEVAAKLFFWTPDRRCNYAFVVTTAKAEGVAVLIAHQYYRRPQSCPVGLMSFKRADGSLPILPPNTVMAMSSSLLAGKPPPV